MRVNTKSVNYVALFQGHSHICTCLLLAGKGLICRHFFQVILQSESAKFAFNLIKSRWYKKDVDLQKINVLEHSSGIIINIGE
jgi:hypothetical protein